MSRERRKNFIMIMLSSHGSDGLISSSDPRMIIRMEEYIKTKIAHKIKENQDILYDSDNPITEVYLADKFFKDYTDNKGMENKIQEQMECKLIMSEAVAESGVCSYFRGGFRNFSDTEVMLINSYELYNRIKPDTRNMFQKFKVVLDQLKEYYKIVISKELEKNTKEMQKTQSQNQILSKTDGLFRVFCPTVFSREKSYSFFGSRSKELESSEHYGIHVLDFNHELLSDLNLSDILGNIREIEPINFTFPVKHLPLNNSSDRETHFSPGFIRNPLERNKETLTTSIMVSAPITPFQKGIYFAREISQKPNAKEIEEVSHHEPYNIKFNKNQEIFKKILVRRTSRDLISSEHFELGLSLLDKLTHDAIILSSEIWMLFDILGFEVVYGIDLSCRELEREVPRHMTKSGKTYNPRDTDRVQAFGFEDPLTWPLCSDDPGLLSTRSQKEDVDSRGSRLKDTLEVSEMRTDSRRDLKTDPKKSATRKGGRKGRRKTRKNRKNRKTRKNKR